MSGVGFKRCENLYSYLQTLTPNVLDNLYSYSATCLAVYRELPDLAKLYIMRLLFVDQAVPQAVILLWTKKENIELHIEVVHTLTSLRVWHEQQMPGGMPGWAISKPFRQNLQSVLLLREENTNSSLWSNDKPLPSDKYTRNAQFLEKYSSERWECILKFMVGITEANEGVTKDIIDIILHAGLKQDDDKDMAITSAGFQFILMDIQSQVWYFIINYLDTVQQRGMDLMECLCFIFQLSFCSLGLDYSTEGMSESLLMFLQHLREIGLVYQRKRKSQRFSPTSLAVNLISGISKETNNKYHHGYIVVETNYRLYAYTNSPVQIALVALFCDMLYRFNNLVVCNLSRDSVRAALSRGITAQQIIHFLHSHCHSEMAKKKSSLPPTIVDQIRLWEIERNRFTFSDGVLYSQFLSQSDFELLENYAKEHDVLVWSNGQKRVMVVTKGGHDDVKRFWKRQKPGR